MHRPSKAPERKPGGMHEDYIETHDAYGCCVVTQWHGGGLRLFGSDLVHHTGMTLQFKTAQRHRGLSNDRHHGQEHILEVRLSLSQWARLISSGGNGSGVPVTIQHRQDGPLKTMPEIAPPAATKREVHGEEMAARLRERLAAMESITARIGELVAGPGSVSKTELRELHKELARHVQQTPGSVQFVYDQFAEATEHVAEDAKIEVEAYVEGVASRLGYESLAQMAPRLTIAASDAP